jgi:hypothetical protein
LQSEGLNEIYRKLTGVVPKQLVTVRNRKKEWEYGYDAKYDMVIISKDGTIGDIYFINNLKIALPSIPKKCYRRNSAPSKQYWEAHV